MYQLPARSVDKGTVYNVTRPELHLLAEGSNINGLVAFDTSDVVVSGSKSIGDGFPFTENELVVFESAIASSGWRLRLRDALIYRSA